MHGICVAKEEKGGGAAEKRWEEGAASAAGGGGATTNGLSGTRNPCPDYTILTTAVFSVWSCP